jgi:glutathione S-transferase
MTASAPLRLYRFSLSGHCHRVELLLSLSALPCELVTVDLSLGEQRKPEFLAKNKLGQVPLLEHGTVTLADSNAILVYLAETFDAAARYWPKASAERAAVVRWFSIAAHELANGPAAARRARIFGTSLNPSALELTVKLLVLLESELGAREFLVTHSPTLADLALYAYTARAPEGNVSLEPYPNIRAWLARIEALPRFVPMPLAKVR